MRRSITCHGLLQSANDIRNTLYSSSTSAGEKHHELTIAEKLDVLHDMDAKISYRKLAEKYNVSLGSLSKIAKNEAADSANLPTEKAPTRRQIYGHHQLCSRLFLKVLQQAQSLSHLMMKMKIKKSLKSKLFC